MKTVKLIDLNIEDHGFNGKLSFPSHIEGEVIQSVINNSIGVTILNAFKLHMKSNYNVTHVGVDRGQVIVDNKDFEKWRDDYCKSKFEYLENLSVKN